MQKYVFHNPSQIDIRYIKSLNKKFIYKKTITSEKYFQYCASLSKYIPTEWDFHKSFQMNNELKWVIKSCIYQEIESITKEEEKVNSFYF